MHLNTKKIAFAGVMLALTEVGIALGSVIETNTLFLLAAASFFVGIVIQEFGLKSGAGFLLAGFLCIYGILYSNYRNNMAFFWKSFRMDQKP